MDINENIRAYGCITKKEVLTSYAEGESWKELVLEANEPFPGYYCMGNLPISNNCKPSYLFFIVKPGSVCSEDNMIRITQKIKKELNLDFDACPGQLTLLNNEQPHIRIHTEDYSIIPKMIQAYKDNGIVFHKNKQIKPYTSMIKIKKYFDLNFLSDGIYKCSENEFFKYIRIPKQIDWKQFETITMLIKNTYDFKNYDYALTSIYQKCGFEDYIRIFSENCDCTMLPVLRKKYVDEINKLPY